MINRPQLLKWEIQTYLFKLLFTNVFFKNNFDHCTQSISWNTYFYNSTICQNFKMPRSTIMSDE